MKKLEFIGIDTSKNKKPQKYNKNLKFTCYIVLTDKYQINIERTQTYFQKYLYDLLSLIKT
jgi:hypothetical protein